MQYRLEFYKRVERSISEFPPVIQTRVLNAVEKLQMNPRSTGCKALTGRHGYYRIRVGDYRIIYKIKDEVLLIIVIAVGHRRNIYHRLP